MCVPVDGVGVKVPVLLRTILYALLGHSSLDHSCDFLIQSSLDDIVMELIMEGDAHGKGSRFLKGLCKKDDPSEAVLVRSKGFSNYKALRKVCPTEGDHVRLQERMSFIRRSYQIEGAYILQKEIMSDRRSLCPSEGDHIRSKELMSFRSGSYQIEGAYILQKEIKSDRRSLCPSERRGS
ncbi:hypothetical protein L1987_17002 [Smallanthus sonchifolius]|uniref:Uncharacterized protein n=1 Tax=Smallanthus sonchifolius TaxID=185202 RepID=A0ACB9IWA2_9ASTR|nr:hypothetical protein L1987_17002 [Smallanthus sonchifolius]